MFAPTEPTVRLDIFQTPGSPLSNDLARLSRPWVRDIAWLLHAPDMATLDCPGRPTLAELGLDRHDRRRAWLAQQETLDADFQRQRLKRRSQRLGIYHETLWQWILERAPRTRLLAHNIALREDGQTLGELDLLYASTPTIDSPCDDRETDVFHVELAIKFFLGLPEGPGDRYDAARWIGVGSFDSLAIKCHRLQSRQLPRGRSPAARRQREALGAAGPLRQRIIMPGCLYHPWHRRLPLPRLANGSTAQGLWCHRSAWPALARQLPEGTGGHLLIKPQWLAPPTTEPSPLAALEDALARHFRDLGKSAHLLLILPDGRQCRIFVVRSEWPPALPLPPPALLPSAR